MFLSLISAVIKSMFAFTGSYSNNVFPETLSNEEETAILNKISSFQPLAYTFNEALGETSSHARA